MRSFNTSGPIVAEDHYHVHPLSRFDEDELLQLIERKRYFVLHAPRQTGKTTVHGARERLILRRDTHLDQLVHKLEEPRVQRVIEPLLSGQPSADPIHPDDLQYVRDLGLVKRSDPVTIANPIYREVIPRELTYTPQAAIPHDPAWYVGADGRLQMGKLLVAFQDFFREHSEHWVERFQYREAGPQLLLQAFLQRIVNSGGRIEREYGVGRRRMDLAVIWPLERSRAPSSVWWWSARWCGTDWTRPWARD